MQFNRLFVFNSVLWYSNSLNYVTLFIRITIFQNFQYFFSHFSFYHGTFCRLVRRCNKTCFLPLLILFFTYSSWLTLLYMITYVTGSPDHMTNRNYRQLQNPTRKHQNSILPKKLHNFQDVQKELKDSKQFQMSTHFIIAI